MDQTIEAMLKAFLRAFATIIGLFFGVILLYLFIAAFRTEDSEVTRTFTVEVQPNAKNQRSELGRSGPVILQLNFDGTIGLGQLSAENTRLRLVESQEGSLKNDRIRAILLNINSGGGLTTDSAAIYQMIRKYKKQYGVPVIAYADGLCASGAYQIALAADTIVSSDSSVVGSVGVLVFPPFFNVAESLEKLGVTSQTVSSGKGKDFLNPFRTWQPNESADIQNVTDHLYRHFVDMVASNRPKLTKDKLMNEYGAQVFPADRAMELGYIDETGYDLPEAIALAAEWAAIEDEEYHVVALTATSWTSELFSNGSSSTSLFTKVMAYLTTPFSLSL